MKYRHRIYNTESQKTLTWDRWQKGDSLHTIAAFLTEVTRQSSAFSVRPARYVRRRDVARG